MVRTILHVDMNNFYASVECLLNPEIKNKPVAVCGNPETRHGIILAKNMIAKSMGVQTGEAIWQAQQKCKNLVLVPPHYELYIKFSKIAKEIYYQYTDMIESFGIDECWLDVTGSSIFGDGKTIADTIRERIKDELGLTVSVGVSFNKIFAKLGSDMKKPDATTVISRDDFQEIVWPQPIKNLLYVGPATFNKLSRYYVKTIGDIADKDPKWLKSKLGVNGIMLWRFANGLDNSPVCTIDTEPVVKSIGNSTTTPRDLETETDVKITLYSLAESVAARLREQGVRCTTVKLSGRKKDLSSFEKQSQLEFPSHISSDIAEKAHELFRINFPQSFSVRSLGIHACNLITDNIQQCSFLPEKQKSDKWEKIENTIDNLRGKFGHDAVFRGIMLQDSSLAVNPKDNHLIHPVVFK